MSLFNTDMIPLADESEFDRHLQTDEQLQVHYLNLITLCHADWSNEEVARAAFHFLYDTDDHVASIEHLIITWRCRRALRRDDPQQIELARAAELWCREQQLKKGQGQGI